MGTSKNIPGAWYKRFCAFVWYDGIYLLYMSVIAIVKEGLSRPPVLDFESK